MLFLILSILAIICRMASFSSSSLLPCSSCFIVPKEKCVNNDYRCASSAEFLPHKEDQRGLEQVASDMVASSRCFGGVLRRIRFSADAEEESFLSSMSVPTFAVFPWKASDTELMKDTGSTASCIPLVHATHSIQRKGLEAIVPGAFVLRHVLSEEMCEEIIHTCETLKFGNYRAGKNNHGAMQIIVSQSMADELFTILTQHMQTQYFDFEIPVEDKAMHQHKGHRAIGINRRWRVYRYAPGGKEAFAPHIDAGFPGSGITSDGKALLWDEYAEKNLNDVVSRLTILMYLNDDFIGGETKFYSKLSESSSHDVIASIKPQAGSILIFPQAIGEDSVEFARMHWPTHEGASVTYLPDHQLTRSKYVIRSDVLFSAIEDNDSLIHTTTTINPPQSI